VKTLTRSALLGLAGLVLAALVVLAMRPGGSPAPDSGGEAAIGGPFHLLDTSGRPVDQKVLAGKWSAVFFGYTNCPDTCPATLQALNAAASELGARRRDFQVVFISVDPARDTPAQMKLYTTSQGYPPGGLVGLTGSPEQVKQVAAAYHAFYSKAGDGPDYAVQHSAAIYLMDPRGRFLKPLDETTPPRQLAEEIRAAMAA
jgi:protein SCO1/2